MDRVKLQNARVMQELRNRRWKKMYIIRRGEWGTNAIYKKMFERYFILHHKIRHRYVKRLNSIFNNRISYRKHIQRYLLNMNENLYNFVFTEEHFRKSKASDVNNKNFRLLDVSYKKERILKTESNNYKKISLTKKNKKFMTTFPLRQNCNINFVYVSKKPYD